MIYSSQLSHFSSFTLNFISHVIKLFSLQPPEVGASAFGWGKFPFFPLGLVGFHIRRQHKKCFSPRGDD